MTLACEQGIMVGSPVLQTDEKGANQMHLVEMEIGYGMTETSPL
jgi:long-subunit acyl-CoA synthetase (AMP-forming)